MASIFILIFLAGCVDLSLPVYERLDTNGTQDGVAIIVDDVKYVMYPLLKWRVTPDSKVIGYAGNWGTAVTSAVGDTENNFLYLCDFGASAFYSPLYRTDKIIPEPSSESVDELIYIENDMRQDEQKGYSISVKDKEIIKEYFEIFKSENKETDFEYLDNFDISITAFSNEVPGASYYQCLFKNEGKLLIGVYEDCFVEMPMDLLEKIAGHKIDLEYLLQE